MTTTEKNTAIATNTAKLFEAILAIDGNDRAASELLKKEVNLKATSGKFGDTLLHLAARRNCMSIGKQLLEKGADKDALNVENKKPWEVARDAGYNPAAAVLKGWKTKVISTVMDKPTAALFEAIETDNVKAMRAAVADGAEVNYVGKHGRTPLHKAAMLGKPKATTYLLKECNADHTKHEAYGYTAEGVANLQLTKPERNEGHKECSKILAAWRGKHGGEDPKAPPVDKKRPSNMRLV
jgi:ankyrin repeat protein